ncbi:MAG: Gfo/Idh/MocA family oxidoreductase [Bryobacteraceae bacterium]
MQTRSNDRITLGVIGVRGRGRDHIDFYSNIPGAHIGAVCDIDQSQTERAVALVEKLQGHKPKVFSDMRKMFEDKSIDAVSIANCNHWHALSTIWACQAGKDVYIEKPASHNIWEGRKMVEAARKYNRIVQVGMQSRTTAHKQQAIELLRNGAIGKIYMAKGLCYKRRKSIGSGQNGPVPAGVDYDLWLGPAPMRPFNPVRFHYNWHWFWDTGNGDIGNQGVHELDIARWGLGKTTHPTSVVSTGGKWAYDDDQETPNTQRAVFDYGDCELVFEVRGLLTHGEGGLDPDGEHTIGNTFFGSDGYLTVDLNGFTIYRGDKREKVQEMKFQEPKRWDTTPHMRNFLTAVRSRKHTDLNADIEQGHISASLCHMANISYRTGRKLQFDPAKERFVNDNDANRLISRHYRAPYVVPERV